MATAVRLHVISVISGRTDRKARIHHHTRWIGNRDFRRFCRTRSSSREVRMAVIYSRVRETSVSVRNGSKQQWRSDGPH